MLTSDLFERALMAPALEADVDELTVLSAFFSPSVASRHLERLEEKSRRLVKVHLIIGWPSSITRGQILGIRKLLDDFPNRFKCSLYTGPGVIHSKVYVWQSKGSPVIAFQGSANYSSDAFDANKQQNILANCSPTEALQYIGSFAGSYQELTHENLAQMQKDISHSYSRKPLVGYESDRVVLSLLNRRTGQTHRQDGLNWGMPNGTKRRPFRETGNREGYDEAIIPVRKSIHDYSPQFFPELKHHFLVETDDDQIFFAVMVQQNRKAIATPKTRDQNNAWLGRYFRNRLGVPLGEYVEREHLEAYGRTDVVVSKLEENIFHLDFSMPTG